MRTLKTNGLTKEQIAKRRYSIGGSDANVIASGNEARIIELWEQKTGRKPHVDLSNKLHVAMGTWTEELNRFWFEKKTGKGITHEGAERTHPEYRFLTCTLDGLTVDDDSAPAVFEAKHTNPFGYDSETILTRYMPQLQHNMFVTGCGRAALSVFVGTDKWEQFWVAYDPFYHAMLLDQEMNFWKAVEANTPPEGINYLDPSAQTGEMQSVDMTGNNEWADLSATYFETADAHDRHKQAQTALKGLVPKDVGRAEGHGLMLKRDKRNALRIYDVRDKNDRANGMESGDRRMDAGGTPARRDVGAASTNR